MLLILAVFNSAAEAILFPIAKLANIKFSHILVCYAEREDLVDAWGQVQQEAARRRVGAHRDGAKAQHGPRAASLLHGPGPSDIACFQR